MLIDYNISDHLLEIDETLTVGPWNQKLYIFLRFYNHSTSKSQGKILLEYEVENEWNLSKEIEEFYAKINLSMENKEDFLEEDRWNDFNLSFAKNQGHFHQFQGEVPLETGRSSDVKKLWTTDANILVKFTFTIRFSDEFLLKKRFQEDIDWIPNFPDEKENENLIHLTTDLQDSKVFDIDKRALIKMSPVFAAMLQNPKNKEVQENKLIFKGEKQSVVRNFCTMLDDSSFPDFLGDPPSWEVFEDMNVDLLLLIFADKYDIKCLYKNLSRYIIKKTLGKRNIEIMKVSNMVNDEMLFEKALKSLLEIKDNHIRQCLIRHPEMITEMMDMVEL